MCFGHLGANFLYFFIFFIIFFGFWVLVWGFGGLPHFPEIPGLSRSSVLGIALVHKIVDFWPNLDRGSFGRHFSAKT